MVWQAGDTVTVSADFGADPASVVGTYTDPSGGASPLVIANPSVGVYTASFVVSAIGRWEWQMVASAPSQVESGFVVVSEDGSEASTYSGSPGSSTLDEVRFLLGDTDMADPELTDAEIGYLVDREGDALGAAIAACSVLAARYASEATSKSLGGLSLSYGDRSRSWAALGRSLSSQLGRTEDFSPVLIGGMTSDADLPSVSRGHFSGLG